MRNPSERYRIVDHPVEEAPVELAIDQPGALSLQLVRHAAGAPYLHVQILIEAVDRAADCLTELVAAIARWWRVLHHVDREWYHSARPCLRLSEHQRQRHRQPVIDIHVVDDREVEVLLNHRLRDVARELGMSQDPRDRPRAPPFLPR